MNLLEGHDSLDILALMGMYVLPADMGHWRETSASLEESLAAVEITALTLVAMGLPRVEHPPGSTASLVPEALKIAANVLRLSQAFAMQRLLRRLDSAPADASLNYLSWRLSSHENIVRGRHYDSIASQINAAVLDNPRGVRAFETVLGFTYSDILAVREAAVAIVAERTRDVVEQMRLAVQKESPSAVSASMRAAFSTFFERPSALRLVTVDEIRERTSLDPERIQSVLDQFSLAPDGQRTALESIREWIEGRSPIMSKGVLLVPDTGYLIMRGAFATEEIRRACEVKLKGSSEWNTYSDVRAKSTEEYVCDLLSDFFLERTEIHRNLKYRFPSSSDPELDLSRTAQHPGAGDVAEADALLLVDGVAICIEVKSEDFGTRPGAAIPALCMATLTGSWPTRLNRPIG